jgi:cold shock CspA family protein
MIGTISSFNPNRMFGFIRCDDGEIFFNARDYNSKAAPEVGDKVHLTALPDRFGRLKACDVRLVVRK